MILRLLICVILTCIFVYAMWVKLQKKVNPFTPSTPATQTDWKSNLNKLSQTHAMHEFCTTNGYDYSLPTDDNESSTREYGGCTYSKESCLADSNPHWKHCTTNADGNNVDSTGKPCDINQKPYLEWVEDPKGGRCVTSIFPPAFITGVCEAQGLGAWDSGGLKCDTDGFCDIDPNNIPTCKLTSGYCDRMGLDYSGKGDGDCVMNDAQNIAEAIFGKTITRTVKRNAELMARECHDNPMSGNCALAITQFLITPEEIVAATADKEFLSYVTGMKKDCEGNIYSSIESFGKCSESLFPEFFLGKQLVTFTDGMLNGMIGWIPGMPHGLISKGLHYIGKYGIIALKAMFHAGEAAIKAFDIAGDYTMAALKNIGLGAVGELVGGVVKNIISFGIGIAKVIANVAQDVAHIFVNDIAPAAYHVFHAVSDAFLHPKEFFEHIAGDITGFITNPIQSIKSAITEIAKISSKVFNIAKMVANHLLKIAGQVLSDLGNALKDLANHIINAFKDVGNEVEHIAKSIWHAFERIF